MLWYFKFNLGNAFPLLFPFQFLHLKKSELFAEMLVTSGILVMWLLCFISCLSNSCLCMALNEVLPCTCFTAEIAVLVIKFPGQKEKIHDRIVTSRPRFNCE